MNLPTQNSPVERALRLVGRVAFGADHLLAVGHVGSGPEELRARGSQRKRRTRRLLELARHCNCLIRLVPVEGVEPDEAISRCFICTTDT